MGDTHRVGVVGLGVISRAYLDTLAGHPAVRVTAVADLDASRSAAVAAGLPGVQALSVEELLSSPDVDTVLNLTVPAAHAEIALGAIGHGKNVYGEKPLAATLVDAHAVMEAAAKAGVGVGCAPDTVLGTGIQTARAAVEAGAIGRPQFASAVMITAGHERWHPHPDFYYTDGGGPLLDMGPYYLASLVHLLGPVRAVTGASSRLRTERVIGSGPRAGERIPVEVDSHVSGVLEHVGGTLTTITTSFDGVATTAAPIEIHGETGTLSVPDPNGFDGEVRLFGLGDTQWRTLPPSAGYVAGARGVGLLDFVAADGQRPPRASGDLALHVLETMTALLSSSAEGRRIELTTSAQPPAAVALTAVEEWAGAASW
ncbi:MULTISPECIES: Gfo/Idh/MocA family protein [unclassified Streptomyces]|uniref:Gfo/Idh/MocA family protein n=1 Tax=unclassified Streptomyces TaxID=2593676 RepID=UPI002253A65E|nr:MULTISPECIES: Gfo/Idh/MocA family oxidoreductase [unclassified Streptomyces]MCX4878810.1 Gfo/Idh/MocA family oxidoreductase [Streptomyces sp. NBC_00847]MCX5418774.1 Gfo/Idh/MocA family oxidoreductase [Streptomyces sp. NBC_00078]